MNRIRSAIARGLKSPLAASAISTISPYVGGAISGAAQYASRLGVPQAITDRAADFVIDKIAQPGSAKDFTSFLARGLQPNATIPSAYVADRTLTFLGETPTAPTQPGGAVQFGTTQPSAKAEAKDVLERVMFDEMIASEAGVKPSAWKLLKLYNDKLLGGNPMRRQILDRKRLREKFEKAERRKIKKAIRVYNSKGDQMHLAQNMLQSNYGGSFSSGRQLPMPNPEIATTGWYFKKQSPDVKVSPGFEPVPASNLADTATIPTQLRKPKQKKKTTRKFATAV